MEEKFEMLIKTLSLLALGRQTKELFDAAHDDTHTIRVLNMAIMIAQHEGGDLEIIIPAGLFHDTVTYRKDDPRNKQAPDESAQFARSILESTVDYPRHKIEHVVLCISECSFSKGLSPSTLESKILQDADRLEATGAISIMRTFSSGGQMGRPLYNPADPFCEKGDPGKEVSFSLNLLYQRLYKVVGMMHTKTAKKIAHRRNKFLQDFEEELRMELGETGVWAMPPSDEKKREEWYARRKEKFD